MDQPTERRHDQERYLLRCSGLKTLQRGRPTHPRENDVATRRVPNQNQQDSHPSLTENGQSVKRRFNGWTDQTPGELELNYRRDKVPGKAKTPDSALSVAAHSCIKTKSKGGHRAIPNEDGSDNRLVSKPRSKLRS
ncbi:hypothetical protein MHU86_22529 [Fragilaria crotonensis]|nr:hypothetical protein MHU86_22529 [Fragilaria crotonensis]